MVSLLVDQERIRSVERREIAIEAADLEEALVTFLQEILYIYEVGRFIPAAINVLSAGSSGVRTLMKWYWRGCPNGSAFSGDASVM